MRCAIIFTCLTLIGTASAQQPPARPQPAATQAGPQVSPDGVVQPVPDVPLPHPERKTPLDASLLSLKRVGGGWQVWVGRTLLRDFGDDETDAREALRAVRELHVDEWVSLGGPRPVVEYGLRNGRATVAAAVARAVVPIDRKTVRAESVKGTWVLRDDETLLFNFGLSRADAEQAAAVVRKYGFDRVAFIGRPEPRMAFLYVAVAGERPPRPGLGALGRQAQIDGLARTGIPVPGLGFVGEMVRIDAGKVEVRRDGYDWVLAHGTDVFARFGAGEWQARDALKVVRDGHFTEWCRFGTPGVTFFLTGGQAPTHVPFANVGRFYGLSDLRVRQIDGKWSVTEGGRPLFEAASADEGEQLVRLLRHFGFDRVCHSGNSPRASLTFLAKSR